MALDPMKMGSSLRAPPKNRAIHAANWKLQKAREARGVDDPDSRRKKGRKGEFFGQGKENNADSEFQAAATKKNLVNIHAKLDRGMTELQSKIVPIMLMNYSNKEAPESSKPSRHRRSSFGSVEMERQAHRLVQLQHGLKGGQMASLLVKLDADIIDENQRKADTMDHMKLKDVVMIDDRIDRGALGMDKYRAASDKRGFQAQEEEEVVEDAREKKKKEKKSLAGLDDEDNPYAYDSEESGSLSPIAGLRDVVSTPRMRHTKSYRGATTGDAPAL